MSYNKHLELYQLIETHKPDIITGTETHLNKDIDSREIFPPNYVYSPPVRKDRDSGEKGGGVVIVWCNISHKSGSVVVGSFYRPPSTSVDYLEQLELSMNNIKQLSGINGKYVLLGGDFNLPDIDWEEGSVKPNPRYTAAINWKMIDIANDFNLIQMVTEPTRQGNILHLLFKSHPDLVDKVYIVPGMSDHDAVICDINLRANLPANPKRNVYLHKRADMEGLRRKLKERFELFEASRPETKSIRTNWDQFKADINNSINEFIPQRTLKNKRSPLWCNANIKRLIRKKQRCYDSARRNGKEQVWRRFRHLRKLVNKELQLAHQQYVNNLLDIDEVDLPRQVSPSASGNIIKLNVETQLELLS